MLSQNSKHSFRRACGSTDSQQGMVLLECCNLQHVFLPTITSGVSGVSLLSMSSFGDLIRYFQSRIHLHKQVSKTVAAVNSDDIAGPIEHTSKLFHSMALNALNCKTFPIQN